MRVLLIRWFLCFSIITSAFLASARTTENFNSSKNIPVDNIRISLQNMCWTFHHFDINNNGWNPNIEGDGAMVAALDAHGRDNAGIYTPVLNVSSDIEVSFDYTFNQDFSEGSSRWMKICLANASNGIVQVLETIQFIGINATRNKKYSTSFHNIEPGDYRLILQYGGAGGNAIIAIDELSTSAPFKYSGGCNTAPVAIKDHITGMANRTATGSLIGNDREKNAQPLTAYLVKGSPDGTVELNEDGTFNFTPAKKFRGNFTSFIYKVCDNGDLCSPNAAVTIRFPASDLVDFKGSYKYDGNVELAWNTLPASVIEKFELERSMDGVSWKNSGIILAKKEVKNNRDYTYIDKVGRNIALKKDLYYRLKQIKYDGSVATSRLLIVRVYNTKAVSMISVTPDPVQNDIAVNVQLQVNAVVSMRIINASGKTILHKTADASHGISNILIEGSSQLKPGMYTLEVIVNGKERMLVSLIKE